MAYKIVQSIEALAESIRLLEERITALETKKKADKKPAKKKKVVVEEEHIADIWVNEGGAGGDLVPTEKDIDIIPEVIDDSTSSEIRNT